VPSLVIDKPPYYHHHHHYPQLSLLLHARTHTMPPPLPTAAEAIADLTSIDADISLMLSTASSAIRCLTTPPDPIDPADPEPSSSSTALGPQEVFTLHADKYHQLLSSITVRLRRQIMQLQAAEIPVAQGQIDVGMLNARNDVVGREMEGEVWRGARGFLEVVGEVKDGGVGEPMEGVA